jgi:hypothetical protein
VTSWLLVHPPLLGPAVMGPLAAVLRRWGDDVAVPDLRAAVGTAERWWERYVAGAADAVGGPPDAVVGFSGAGVVLPAVAAAVAARRVVWVDAVVPAREGVTAPSPAVREMVASLTRDGRIAPWPTWWGPDAMADLLPDAGLRAAISAEAPSLPGDFYDEAVPVPARWPEDGARYVWLSPAYDGDAAEARARGWTVVGDGEGLHTDVAVEPGTVAALLG